MQNATIRIKNKKEKSEVAKKNNIVSSVQKDGEEMGIQKNKNGGYVVSVWNGQRYPSGRKKYIREEVDTKKAAEKRERELLKLIREIREMKQDIETLVPEKTNTQNNKLFQEAAYDWLLKKKDDIALSTFQRYQGIVKKHLLPVFGKLTVGDITTEIVQKYFDQEKAAKKLSGTSLRQHFVVLENVLKSEGSHVMYNMKRPKKKDTEIRCIKNPFELRAFVESFRGSILFLPVFLAANTGMRLSEIAALRWRDIDLQHGYISVSKGLHWSKNNEGKRYYYEKELKTKNAKRTIKISSNAIKVLKTAKTKSNAKLADFVCTDARGNPISRDQASKSFVRHAKRHGYDISFHSLRHSHATILIMIYKVPLKTVSRRLGHSDITVTLSIYTSVIQEQDELAAAAMEKIFAATEGEELDQNSNPDENDTTNDTAELK